MSKIDSAAFLSPFSCRRGYKTVLTKLDSRWQGNPQADLQGVDLEMIKAVDRLKMVTALQAHKTFYRDNSLQGTIKKLNKFSNKGLLTKHMMQDSLKNMVFFTLGPAGARLLCKPFKYNWWMGLKGDVILKQLVLNQLFLRIKKEVPCLFYSAEYPLTGVIIINDISLSVVVIRGDLEDAVRDINLTEDIQRLIVICEDKSQIRYIGEKINSIATRYTTDYELCCTPLNEAFYLYENGEIIREELYIFDPPEQEESVRE